MNLRTLEHRDRGALFMALLGVLGATFGAGTPLRAAELVARLASPEIELYQTMRVFPEDGALPNPSAVLDVLWQAPDGRSFTVPCFDLDGHTTSRPRWESRLAPRQTGSWTGRIRKVLEGQTNYSERFTCRVLPASTGTPGFLHVAPDRLDALVFDSGRAFRGLGVNLGWEPQRHRGPAPSPHGYDVMIPSLARQGANFIRTWMCPWNLPLEWRRHGLGKYDPDAAQRLDELLELARQQGVYVMLVLDYHGVLRTTPDFWGGNDEWKNHPYHKANGGPCDTPADFFTNEEAKQLYRQRLRYLAGRWGSHPHLAAWELWNEIDIPVASESIPWETVVAWHRDMAAFLHDIDPADRPVSTSLSHADWPALWQNTDLDFVMTHYYRPTDDLPGLIRAMVNRYDKPYVVGEFGFSWKHPNEVKQWDRYREELRLGLWRGLFSPTPILPMSWWWEHHEDRGEFAALHPVRRVLDQMMQSNAPWHARPAKATDALETLGLRQSPAGDPGAADYRWHRNPTDQPILPADEVSGDLDGETGGVLWKEISTMDGQVRAMGVSSRSAESLHPSALPAHSDRVLAQSAGPETLSDWTRILRWQLTYAILPYWLTQTVDHAQGGFLLADDWGKPGRAEQKQLVGQARMIWGFAHAHRHGFDTPDGAYLAAARQGYQFLIRHFLDPENGGYFWTTDLAGHPLNRRKILYGQAFVVYALVEYHRVTGDPEALERALALFRTLQKQAHDPAHEGWIEHFQADWKPILTPENGTIVEIAGLKSANTHLHLMEAWTELYEVTKDKEVRGALEEALRLNQGWFYPVDPAQSAFHRHLDGTRATGGASDGLSYGHNVEFAWLMIRAEKVLGRPPSWPHALAHLEHALAHGYDHERGGLYNKGFGNEPAVDTEKVWWSQAEWVAALSDAVQHQSNDAFTRAIRQTLTFVETHMMDPQDAVWIASVTREGTPKWTSKAHDWKANYHDVRAMIKLIENHPPAP